MFYYYGNKMMAVDIKNGADLTAGKPRFLFEGEYSFGDVSQDSQRFLIIQAVEPEQPATQINLGLNWFQEAQAPHPDRGKVVLQSRIRGFVPRSPDMGNYGAPALGHLAV